MRFFQALLATSIVSLSASGCRTGGKDHASTTLDDQTPPPSAGPAQQAPVDCKTFDSLQPAKNYNGQRIFDVSGQCVFNENFHEVRLRILGETFEKVLKDGCAKINSGFGHVIEAFIDGHRVPDVGIRVRGNTSKCNPKRQFRLRFDAKKAFSVSGGQVTELEFPNNKNRRLFGLADLNLRASGNDPSMVRERTSSKIFEASHALAPVSARGALVYRTTFTKLYVSFDRKKSEGPEGNFTRLFDDKWFDYKGVYTLAENIDDVFLTSRFAAGDAKLKNFHMVGADEAKAAFSREEFQPEGWSFEYIDGEDEFDDALIAQGREKLFQLFDAVTELATEEQIAQLVDVDAFVNYTAGTILAGHWDSMLGNRNNDLLFFDPATQRWKVVTWDLDNSLGVLKPRYDEMMRDDLFRAAAKRPARLFEALFAPSHPNFREALRARVKAMVDGGYSGQQLGALVDQLKGQVMPRAEPWEGLKNQLFEDIKNFAKARRTKLGGQLTPTQPN